MRATWKGRIKVAELTVPAGLYAAASSSERISFHILNRKTGNRVRREYVDEETGKPVEKDDQVKGYETEEGDHVVLEPDEISAAIPVSDKTIDIKTFVKCSDVDEVYFDRPYFLAPDHPDIAETFAVLREGMKKESVAALGRALLFRRCRTVMIRAQGEALLAHTLNFDYEVRASSDVFGDLPDLDLDDELLELAGHIIDTKAGSFDPAEVDDRYDRALADLVKAKQEGRKIAPGKTRKPAEVTNLRDALRKSAKKEGASTRKSTSRGKVRKAG